VDLAIRVAEPGHVGEARRAAGNLARRLGGDDTFCGKVALVATEAATNLIKHAEHGELLLRPCRGEAAVGLELLALDRGPGMADPARCLRDGFSTAGSPGTGLGAIRRLTDLFELYSLPGMGTALFARLWLAPDAGRPAPARVEVGVVHVPRQGEEVCGDGWAIQETTSGYVVLVADGLGHGVLAASAARQAIGVLRERQWANPVEMVHAMHLALRSSRGAAIGVADVNLAARQLRFVGVGNIAAAIIAAGEQRSLVSHNGTVGHEMRKVQEFTYPFPPGALLVMYSDGIGTGCRLDPYPGLASRHLDLLASILYRDFHRGRDDATILAIRESEGAP
jgi:anti-sigma regulatory factor (Ser/Thr protein kinase)